MPLYYGSAFMCESWPGTPIPAFKSIGSGYDATGAFYQLAPNRSLDPNTMDIVRGTDSTTEVIARTPSAQIVNLAVDSTYGRLYLAVRTDGPEGIVVISGLPTLFDTLLSFVPSGKSVAAVTPARPDGLRSADSVQAWTGDVRSLPDWSQAAPLVCMAATAPTPGQIVTVADTLPDPTPGHARYYVMASQSGTHRRLGRQYVSGAFSARDPTALPVCQ